MHLLFLGTARGENFSRCLTIQSSREGKGVRLNSDERGAYTCYESEERKERVYNRPTDRPTLAGGNRKTDERNGVMQETMGVGKGGGEKDQ